MGAPLVPVYVSTADLFPHLNIKHPSTDPFDILNEAENGLEENESESSTSDTLNVAKELGKSDTPNAAENRSDSGTSDTLNRAGNGSESGTDDTLSVGGNESELGASDAPNAGGAHPYLRVSSPTPLKRVNSSRRAGGVKNLQNIFSS